MPDDIHAELVKLLHADSRTTLLGGLPTSVSIMICGALLQSHAMTGLGVVGLLVTAWRWTDMRLFWRRLGRNPSQSAHAYRAALRRYSASAFAYAFIVGVATGITQFHDHTTAKLIMVALCIANLAGVVSRNYAFRSLVDWQTVLLLLPPLAGLAQQGATGLAVAAICLPGCMTFRSIADHLRAIFVGAVKARRTAERERQTLDAAMGSMPMGLMMFDAGGRCVVANSSAARYARVDASEMVNRSPRDILELMVGAGAVSRDDTDRIEDLLTTREPPVAYLSFTVAARRTRSVQMLRSVSADGTCTALFEDISDKLEAAAVIERMQRTDRLTGSLNREQLTGVLDTAAAAHPKGSVALIACDIDEFDRINTHLGRPKGDAVLIAVAHALESAGGESGTVLRTGGDRFALVVPDPSPEGARDAVRAVVDHLCDGALARAVERECGVSVRATMGVAWAALDEDGQGANRKRLHGRATMALDQARRVGPGGWAAYDEAMGRDAERRRTIERDLPRALDTRSLSVVFQPIADLARGGFAGAEALVRWQHPTLGTVRPDEFLGLAARMDLMPRLGRFVLDEACRNCANWPEPLGVAVNLSPCEFLEPDLVATVAEALARHELAPERLTIEITESAAIEDIEATRDVLGRLRNMGLRTALDDFGTGFSSLSHLHHLPLDKLKLDRSFVTGLERGDGAVLVRHICALAHDLGLSLVVEGVETREQLDVLEREAQIDHVQGFLYARPMGPIDAARAMVAERSDVLVARAA